MPIGCAWACCNVCRPGSWMHLGEGMPGCPASDVTTLEREEAMRGRCNKHTGRLRLSK